MSIKHQLNLREDIISGMLLHTEVLKLLKEKLFGLVHGIRPEISLNLWNTHFIRHAA
jgi:hypothetical protein